MSEQHNDYEEEPISLEDGDDEALSIDAAEERKSP